MSFLLNIYKNSAFALPKVLPNARAFSVFTNLRVKQSEVIILIFIDLTNFS